MVLVDDFLDGGHLGLQQSALARSRRNRTRIYAGRLPVVFYRLRQHDVAGQPLVSAVWIVDEDLVAGDNLSAGLKHLRQAEGDGHFLGFIGQDLRGEGQ